MQGGQQQQDDKQRTRRKFCEEFKRDAVEMARNSGRPIADVAAELGIYYSTLGNWIRRPAGRRGRTGGPVDRGAPATA